MERGRIIGEKYELLSPIGEGGMGVVWRARHVALGREVALKRVVGNPAETTLQRFLREAQSAAAVRAPNVVDVLDYGRDPNGEPYLVMELLEGESLDQRLRRHPPLGLEEALDLLDQALAGLDAIHQAGIVHRDLKPANLFLAKVPGTLQLVVKVLDFGIARPAAPEASALTHTMQTLGTPHYMSPEQVRSAKNVDARSDVYAMGVIFYQVLTGRLPFDGPSATAVIAAIVTEDPPAIRSLRPELSLPLAATFEKAMSRRADERFPDARALRDAIAGARMGGVSSEVELDRVSVNAPTVVSENTPGTASDARAVSQARGSSRRSGRRGFFAVFGMLGTATAAGLAFLSMQRPPSAPQQVSAAGAIAASPAAPPQASAPRGAGGGPTSGASQPAAGGGVVLEPTVPTILGEPAPLSTVALRWRSLEPSDRSGLVVRPLEGGFVLATTSPGLARRVGAALGARVRAESSPAPPDAILTPRLFRTNARSNVRRAPTQESALAATTMEDALLVGLIGTFDDLPSGDGETEGWVRVFASDRVDGWIARRLLEEDARCVPALGAVAPTEVLARASLREGPRHYGAIVAVDVGSVRVFETDATCTVEERHHVRTAGEIAEAFLTAVSEEGDSVLVLGEWPRGRVTPDGRQRWTARVLSASDAVVWESDLLSGQNLGDARREGLGGPFSRGPAAQEGFFPLRIRRPHTRIWLVWSPEEHTFVSAGTAE
ncbi:MAG: serine/threonine-protein kinase [Deltaproteobacteria bacterium]